jgi:pyruvate,water dikinase
MKKGKSGASAKLEKMILSARKESESEPKDTKQEDFVVSGIGASFGVVTGKITVVDSVVEKKFSKQDILLIKKYSSEMEAMIIECGGVIMETGGLTSDTAILCREVGVPAVVGTNTASDVLKSGDWVKIDGNTGSVYMAEKVETKSEVHPVVEAYSEGNVAGVDLLKEEEQPEEVQEESPLPPKDSTLPPCATRVFSMIDNEPKKIFEYIGNSNGIVYIDLDKILLEDGKHIMAYVEDKQFVDFSKKISERVLEYVELAHGDEVIVSIGSGNVGEFRKLTKGKTYENSDLSDEVYGATHYVNNVEMLKRVIKIVKRIRNVYKKRNVSIALHSPMSDEAMKEFKKQLLGEKLRRTSTFKVYAILDNPSEIIMADEISAAKIDGLVLNMPRIARQMQGFKADEVKAKYDLARNSVFKVLDNVLDVVKANTDRVIVVVENSKPLIRYCVQAGVYGISVFSEDIAETRKVVSEEESKIILGK